MYCFQSKSSSFISVSASSNDACIASIVLSTITSYSMILRIVESCRIIQYRKVFVFSPMFYCYWGLADFYQSFLYMFLLTFQSRTLKISNWKTWRPHTHIIIHSSCGRKKTNLHKSAIAIISSDYLFYIYYNLFFLLGEVVRFCVLQPQLWFSFLKKLLTLNWYYCCHNLNISHIYLYNYLDSKL